MTIAIKIENLSKHYRLGTVSTRTLSNDRHRWWTINIRGKDDPYLKIGEGTRVRHYERTTLRPGEISRRPMTAQRMTRVAAWK